MHKAPLVSVQDLSKSFTLSGSGFGQKTILKAVQDVSFDIHAGETLGLVGESGSGKSTIGKMVMDLLPPTSGSVSIEGKTLHMLKGESLRSAKSKMQIIFQDPFGSLNPRMRVGDIIAEPLVIQGAAQEMRQGRVKDLLTRVGLNPSHSERYPHEFSGGQRQRIGIARALATEPKFIVCDEAVSALDVSVQAQIVNLLQDLQQDLGISYLFIAHDLAVVRHISHRIAVMYLGSILEIGTKEQIYSRPQHPYTKVLLSAVPVSHPRQRGTKMRLKGEITPTALDEKGCRFKSRCPLVIERCGFETPRLRATSPGHALACHVINAE